MTDTAQAPIRARSARVARTSRRAKPGPRKTQAQAEIVPPTVPAAASAAPAAGPKTPRDGSRLAAMVALMRQPEGATVDALVEATSWQRHSVRGALAGALKKTYGLTITSTIDDGVRVYRIPMTEAVA